MAKKKEKLTPEERLQAALVPDWEQPYKVPENWCWVKLSTIGKILNGFAFKSKLYVDSGIRIIRISNVQDGYIEDEKPVYYPVNAAKSIESYMLKSDDLLMSLTGNVGRVALLETSMLPAALNQRVACIRIINEYIIHKKYLFKYFLRREFVNDSTKNSKGSAQLNMSTEWLKNYPVPLPPFSEQQRIVDRIESLFAKLDEAKQKAQDALDSFEPRKAAILHKAFTGELTAQWRQEHGVNYESWKTILFRDIISSGPQNGLYKPKNAYGQGTKILRIDCFYDGVVKEWSTLKRLNISEEELVLYGLNLDDIVINRVNSMPYLGKSALIRDLPEACVFESNMMRMVLDKSTADPEYIILYLNSPSGLCELRKNAKQAVNQASINQGDVKDVCINLPLKAEQAEIVRILNDLLDKEQQAKEAAEAVLQQIDLIKKSILSRAFRGELGTNDPNEESAVELIKSLVKVETQPKTRAKSISIPREVDKRLESELERKIIKLYYQADMQSLPIDTLMSASSKKFEVIESIRKLEQRGIIKKQPNGNYMFVR